MKTGNSVLAVFFFYMAFRIPIEINNLALGDDVIYELLSVMLFGVCIILGCVSLEYGRDSRKTIDKKVQVDKISDKRLSELPTSLKDSMSVTDIHAVSEVDKNLPVIKAVDEKDAFAEISTNIDDIIQSK